MPLHGVIKTARCSAQESEVRDVAEALDQDRMGLGKGVGNQVSTTVHSSSVMPPWQDGRFAGWLYPFADANLKTSAWEAVVPDAHCNGARAIISDR